MYIVTTCDSVYYYSVWSSDNAIFAHAIITDAGINVTTTFTPTREQKVNLLLL